MEYRQKTESNKVNLVEEENQNVATDDVRSLKSVQRRILSGGGSLGKEGIMDNSFNLGHHCLFFYYLLSPPGLKAQVSFHDHMSSVRLSICKLFTFWTSFS